jgi:hypothetical protein
MTTPQQPTESDRAFAARIFAWPTHDGFISEPELAQEVANYVSAALAASRRDLEQAQRWICTRAVSYGGDQACAQCYPHSEILIKDFVCARHKAIDAAVKGVGP